MSNAGPRDFEKILVIAKKYYEWAEPKISIGRSEYSKAVNWKPTFDGKKKDCKRAASFSTDTCIVGTMGGMGDMTVALACAAFDLCNDNVAIAQNLGCAIAIFCDNNTDAAVTSREKEIYEDAETVLLYSISLSMEGSFHTYASLGPLTSLGNLYLDMKKYEEGKNLFMAARKIDDGYMPAISGLTAYYKKTNKPEFIVMMLAAAKKKPSPIGKGANQIDEETKKSEKLIKEGGQPSEEELEKMIDVAETIQAPCYGDLFKELDPKGAERIIQARNDIQSKMIIRIPNIHILTEFTDINEDNEISVKCAAKAVEDDVKYLEKYAKLYGRGIGNVAADFFQNTGAGDFNFMGMKFHDFMRDASEHPEKYENMKNAPEAHLRMDNLNKFVREAEDSVRAMSSARQGFGDESTAARNIAKVAAKANLLVFPLSLNPFEFANPYDILLQQYNVPLLVKKKQVFEQYCVTVLKKTAEILADISKNFSRAYGEIKDQFNNEEEKVKKKYEDAKRKFLAENDGEGGGGGGSSSSGSTADEHSDDRMRLELHALHEKYYPALNQCTKRYWLEATGVAARMYTRLERNLPRMYKDAMKHIMFISDEKVRREQTDQLVGWLATTLVSSIEMVLSAYNGGNILRIEMCGCDPEQMEQIRLKLEKERKEKENEKLARQKQAMDAFKRGEIDTHPLMLKAYSDKYDYELDLGIIKHRSNANFSSTNVYIPSGDQNLNVNLFSNEITKASRLSVDLEVKQSINDPSGRFGLGAKEMFGITIGWDADGNIRIMDKRVGMEVSGSVGPVEGALGVTTSMVRGTTLYGEIRPIGNDYIDILRKDAFGGLTGGPEILKKFPLKVWRGEYRLEETK